MLKHAIARVVYLIAATFFFIILAAVACLERLRSIHKNRNTLPRVVWGPTPILSIKYWSQAVKQFGYESQTLVHNVYHINAPSDFDLIRDDFAPHCKRLLFLKPYFIFAWCLLNFDIFSFFFDGGFLAATPLAFFECQLLRLAGKKIIVTPYGSDIAVSEYLGVFRGPMLESYPQLAVHSERTKNRVLYFCKWANFIIRNMQAGFLPKYDFAWPNFFAIDVDLWKSGPNSPADAHSSEVVVVHSSNHRLLKGTDALIKAVEDLRAEGLKISLRLFERCPNEEVREAVIGCDIVAEQFIGGYAMSAIEGMSAGKPVLSHLSWQGEDIRTIMRLEECPIVDTSADQIKEKLRLLAEDPQLRHRLGEAGRQYVLKYHSYDAVGKCWDSIFRHVWFGEPFENVRFGGV
jgi:hypothetical protein